MPDVPIAEMPGFSMNYKVIIKGQPDVVFTYEGDMPQEIADQYQQIIGNGLARVSIGVPMDRKIFGNGAGVHVSVSLACNQDSQTIHQGFMLAQQAVLFYAKQGLGAAMQEFNNIVGTLPRPQD